MEELAQILNLDVDPAMFGSFTGLLTDSSKHLKLTLKVTQLLVESGWQMALYSFKFKVSVVFPTCYRIFTENREGGRGSSSGK